MGKYSLLISISVMGALTLLTYQGTQTEADTSNRQSRRQGQVIARQIARSGYNAALSEARLADDPNQTVSQIVDAVDTLRGTYQGGTYEAWLEKLPHKSFDVEIRRIGLEPARSA